jgi:hypothetical protein
MKISKITILSSLLMLLIGATNTSCSDALDLGPIDYYGSESYWKTEAHAEGYIDGIHKHLRDAAWQHTITFGELRGGHYITGTSGDGSSVSGGAIASQNFDSNNTGVTKFGDLYGRITNLNLFIARVSDADFIGTDKKNYFLGIVYGLRAFYYFDLYRIYGGVPLRLGVEVIDGELDPTKLYLPRATPAEVMAQIKSDLQKSLDYFGDVNSFNPYGMGSKVYWNKAATEALIGEVYLWNSKVTTGNNAANVSDLAVAKQHLLNVVNNYGLSLQPNFADVFDARNKANSEIIFAIRFAENEASNGFGSYVYNIGTGQTTNSSYLEDGSLFVDPLQVAGSGSMQRYEYKEELFRIFDVEDSRRDATFLAAYYKDDEGNLTYRGTHVRKNIGLINSSGIRIWIGDMPFYRLSWVYLTLAEIANMEGNNTKVEEYINIVRERAYGENWSPEFAYEAGDFTANELAILAEKDKEFVQEGQRWWDIRRMTLTKGGKPLVFTPQASFNGEPILNESTEAHKVLWPIDRALLDNDDALEQTPGY